MSGARANPPAAAGTIEISEEAGVRYLHFSSDWVQGAMRIRRPFALELAYTREMMAGLLLREAPWPRKALLIGLGAGSLAKFIHRHLPGTHGTVVEIDPHVDTVARLHFRLPDDDGRLVVRIGDGAEFMRTDGESYDYILVDGFDKHARAGVLDTAAFYADCRARLSGDGLLAVNLLGRSRGFRASAGRIDEAFDGRSLVFPSCDSGNAIAFAAVGEAIAVDADTLRTRATRLREDSGLNLLPTVTRLEQAGTLAGGCLRL